MVVISFKNKGRNIIMAKDFDFKYYGFGLSRESVKTYMNSVIAGHSTKGRPQMYTHADGLVDAIIQAIATKKATYDPNDTETCQLLEQLVTECGYDENGSYTDEARNAIKNLYIAQGKDYNETVLTDKKTVSAWDKTKSKLKSLFGFKKKKEANSEQPNTTPKEEKIITKQNSAEQEKQQNKNKKPYWSATISTILATGLALAFYATGDKEYSTASNADSTKVKKFETIYKLTPDGTSYVKFANLYNIEASMKKHTASLDSAMRFRMPIIKTLHHNATQEKVISQPATDSLSVQLTRTSKSALEILLGVQGAKKLCDQVRSQINAGVFAAPNGMSVERIAHAMEMSRVYEGNSVILNALTSKTKLTPAQQKAFNDHIDSIGDMGVKLQKRVAAQHKLSKQGKFNKAKKSIQIQHVKNLKQLKMIKKAMHVK